ncbi:RIP metalloprotease RseP [Tichowtungia aerotolerans]|uniref:Zinc metalloprotease n=1 Tax=Tichowtungia aerotolerans TaxID=2697043 RepID=A0A6P1M5Y5_9BACT|nr:RIP metalloprotease RseP [Tichowtungia aerotolerans]QHI70219.1 RIP metalloprotease RseP [Tichowtungia aerotolerans]
MLDILLSGWTIFYSVVLALFLFGVTVFVHEFGHFIVARKCGLKVLTFSIGFGRGIVQWERGGIHYKIGWIPFGGYVSLPQLDPSGMERLQGSEDAEPLPPISPWKKIAVAVAGPVGNIILASLIAVAIWLVPGDDAGSQIRSLVGAVETNSAAYAAGLRAGDEIIAVNGTTVKTWYDFSVETLLQAEDTAALTVLSDGVEKTIALPVVEREGGERLVDGISPAVPCVFGAVYSDTPAERAGLFRGDEVLAFNDDPIISWDDFTERIQSMKPGESAKLTVVRKGEPQVLSIAPEYNEEYDRMMIGVQLGGGSGMPWMQYKNPLDQIKYDALAIVRVLQALTSPSEAPQAAKGLGGPVAIFDMLMLSIKMGLLNTLGLIRFLNINLAILNLMPIPVLDGGHIVFSLWEGITRRKVNAKAQAILVNACAILLIGAMLLLTVNDIDRKFQFKKFFSNLITGQAETVKDSAPAEGE